MTPVIVTWLDAFAHHGTADLAECEAFRPLLTYSTGHMICRNEHGVTIVLDNIPGQDYREPHFIPACMVVEVVPLIPTPPVG